MNRHQSITAYKTLVSKDVTRFMRIWIQTLLSPIITSILYFIIFGKIIGKHVGYVHGIAYMQFIVPGMVMMQLIMVCYINASSSFFISKFNKSIEEILVSPMSHQTVLLAYITSSTLRGLLVSALIIIVALLFTHLHIYHVVIMLITIIVSAVLFSTLGIINGLYAKKFDDVNFIPSFILTPLNYLGGVFYAISALPPLWQHLSLLNPIVYIINTFRYSMLGFSDINAMTALTVLLVITIVMYCFCLYLLKKGCGLTT